MKRVSIALLIASLAMASCNDSKKSNTTEKNNNTSNKLQHADWLVGIWKRGNEEKGKQTFEVWEKVSEKGYKGEGYTMRNNDTLSKEFMNLYQTDGKWVLDVALRGESKPTTFQVTHFSSNEFTAINNNNPFPKSIQYWKTGNILRAKISNDTLVIPFEFLRLR